MKTRRWIVALAGAALLQVNVARGEEEAGKPPAVPEGAGAKEQYEEAATKIVPGKVAKTDEAYTTALDAHDLDGIKAKAGQDCAFKGTVSAIYAAPSGKIRILNFDPQYKKAMSAVVKSEQFDNFPDLETLVGKEVLITGKVVLHRERPEIQLKEIHQLRLVE